jgi:hypothetical protein
VDVCLLWVFCQVEVSASGWSLVQRSPTECGVSEYDLETLRLRRPRPTRAIKPCAGARARACVCVCVCVYREDYWLKILRFGSTIFCLFVLPAHSTCSMLQHPKLWEESLIIKHQQIHYYILCLFKNSH